MKAEKKRLVYKGGKLTTKTMSYVPTETDEVAESIYYTLKEKGLTVSKSLRVLETVNELIVDNTIL